MTGYTPEEVAEWHREHPPPTPGRRHEPVHGVGMEFPPAWPGPDGAEKCPVCGELFADAFVYGNHYVAATLREAGIDAGWFWVVLLTPGPEAGWVTHRSVAGATKTLCGKPCSPRGDERRARADCDRCETIYTAACG